MPVAEPARIEDAIDGFGTGIDAGSGELVTLRNLDNFFYAFGAILRSDGRRLREDARWNLCRVDGLVRAAGSFVTVRHGQQVRIRVLYLGERFRRFNYSPQASIIEVVGCGASRASAKGCAHRDDVVF